MIRELFARFCIFSPDATIRISHRKLESRTNNTLNVQLRRKFRSGDSFTRSTWFL